MADTYEKDLGQKSSLTVNDYIRVVGSDNASYKQLVSDVAKKIIENYTGSSLAGASQSVKSAIDSLNSKIKTKQQNFANLTNSSANTYYISLGNVYTALGIPSSSTILSIICLSDSGFRNMFTFQISSNTLYLLFPYGHTFTNATIGVTIVYM